MRPRSHRPSWLTSPTAAAILHRLACRGPASIKVLEAECYASENTIRILLRQMLAQDARAVHIRAWISSRDYGGHPSMEIALGDGVDAKPLPPLTKAQIFNRWAQRKRARFGREIASKMIRSRNFGGADRVVIDGKTVYERRGALPC